MARVAWVSDSLAKTAWFLKAAACVHLFREHVAEVTVPVGVSMVPTFRPRGDAALLEHVTFLLRDPRVGDVVIARSPSNARHHVVKRVVGVAGDTVVIPLATPAGGPPRTETVPPGSVWLQGDNYLNSLDSRSYGPVPLALVQGRVFLKFWPPWEACWIGDELVPVPEADARR